LKEICWFWRTDH